MPTLFSIQVRIDYDRRPRTYMLTPHRKHMGRAVARKSYEVIATEALTNALTRKYVIRTLGKELAKEIKTMASDSTNSIMRSQNPEHLQQFSWDLLLNELSQHAPLLSSLLISATRTKVARSNTKAVIGMCAAILMKQRNSRMNLVQRIISLILYASGTSKQVCSHVHKIIFCYYFYAGLSATG